MPLTAERKQQWIEDLRKYKDRQGFGFFWRDYNPVNFKKIEKPRMCAVGVLLTSEFGEHMNPDSAEALTYLEEKYPEIKSMPKTILFRTGWPTTRQLLYPFGLTIEEMNQVARLNDMERMDFETIANWVEANIPVVED